MTLPDVHAETRGVPFASGLAGYGDRVALITPDTEISYRELAERVDALARRLGTERRLVLLAARNTVDSVVAYLAALAAGHPVLLVPGGNPRHVDTLTARYDPDAVITDGAVQERRRESGHLPHPDLALLLSTSGSTGSPKLVRLSHRNLQANAESIAEYLDIRDTDRAATTLPMHYCYGLSVVNSHLLRGAALILTELSVVDPCFWELFGSHRGTSFAGVPYTFDLLDQVDFDRMRLPHLRYVTQAGGRLAPDRVRRYAALGRRAGWDFVVMYGQTEATARMAYLPPRLAESHPEAIGVPIPGGSFRLDPLPDDPDVGELVYSGPNVMLGYAESPADLGLGRTVDELRTGDLARRTGDGLYEIVGRRHRFLKIFGHRIDPQRIETALQESGLTACCTGTDTELHVAVQGCDDEAATRRLIATESGLPPRAVRVHPVDQLPRLASGKPDHQAVLEMGRLADRLAAEAADPRPSRHAADSTPSPDAADRTPSRDAADRTPSRGAAEPRDPAGASRGQLRALYGEILDCPDVTDDCSFVSLGGDSLSYVELSVRLETLLGRLPAGWHTLSIRDLHRVGRQRRRRLRMLDTSVALRAIAIVLIVGTHIKLFAIVGGAHLLFGVAGFNVARFQLGDADRDERSRHLWRAIGRIAVPSMIWIAGAVAFTSQYWIGNVFLLNSLLGPRGGQSEWHFWFVEALVYILVVLAVLLAVPGVDRLERRMPFGLPIVLLAAGLVIRYDLLGIADRDIPSAVRVFWLFALGWAAAKATQSWQRVLVSTCVVVTVPGFFGQPQREAIIIGGMLLLVWVASVPGLPGLNRVAAVLAGSSLYIYVTHWQVFPLLDDHSPVLALAVSLAVGVGYAVLTERVTSKVRGWRTRRRLARAAAEQRQFA